MAPRQCSRHQEPSGRSGVVLGPPADELRREIRGAGARVAPEPPQAPPQIERLDEDVSRRRRLRPIEMERVLAADDDAGEALPALDRGVIVAVVADAEVGA